MTTKGASWTIEGETEQTIRIHSHGHGRQTRRAYPWPPRTLLTSQEPGTSADIVDVTIMVTEVNEAPEVTGDTPLQVSATSGAADVTFMVTASAS